jgi:hypothetical protein
VAEDQEHQHNYAYFLRRGRSPAVLIWIAVIVSVVVFAWWLYANITESMVWGWATIGCVMIVAILLPLFQVVISHAEKMAYQRFPGVRSAVCGYFQDEKSSRGVLTLRLLVVTEEGLLALGGLGSFRQLVWAVPADQLGGAAVDYWGQRAQANWYAGVRITTTNGRERFFLPGRVTRPRTCARISVMLARAIRRTAAPAPAE